jgi:hypothetical protein
VTQQNQSSYVITDPTQIQAALWASKNVTVLHIERRDPDVELAVEQQLGEVRCPICAVLAKVKIEAAGVVAIIGSRPTRSELAR